MLCHELLELARRLPRESAEPRNNDTRQTEPPPPFKPSHALYSAIVKRHELARREGGMQPARTQKKPAAY